MTNLLYTAREVMNFARNVPKVIGLIYEDLTALDTRIDDVEAGTVAAGSIATAELADDAVTAAKLDYFLSTEQTGDGSAQNVAHGLGVSPTAVIIIPSGLADSANTFTFTKGSTNVVVTATATAKYYVLAIK